MGSRITAVFAAVLFAAAGAFLIVQAVGIWPRVKFVARARRLEAARASGKTGEIVEVALALSRLRPRDGSLRLIHARALLAAGKFKTARNAYAKTADVTKDRKLRAAAEIGRGCAILMKLSRPAARGLSKAAARDFDKARQAFEKALEIAPRLAEAKVMLAVAALWTGDIERARAAVEGAKGLLEREPAAVLACVRAYLAAAKGDAASAHKEFRRARALEPRSETPLGRHVARCVQMLDLEDASRPGAGRNLRRTLVKHLKAEGPRGITTPRDYPVFLRAAFSCARSEVSAERSLGMDLLARAAEEHEDDPAPLLVRVAATAFRLLPLWEKAAGFAKSARRGAGARASVSVLDLLPGTGSAPKPAGKSPSNPHLAQIDAEGDRIDKDAGKAATLLVAGGGRKGAPADVAGALGLFEYIFRWRVRAAELSTDPAMRRTREAAAAALVLAADKLLGPALLGAPGTPDGLAAKAAALMRNAGVLFARQSAWKEALACFRRSLEILPGQGELEEYLEEQKGIRVAAVYPAVPGELQPSRPLLGAEFFLPEGVKGLKSCKVKASLGLKGGTRKAIQPLVSGTGLWYAPEEGELPDGLIEARFTVTSPLSKRVEAVVSFRVDGSPPKITSCRPGRDAVIDQRHPLIRIKWREPSGLDPESVEVALEPVKAVFFRRVLVTKGRQKSSRYVGDVTWKKNDAAVRGGAGASGEIVTGTTSEIPTGIFRVRVRMKDTFGHQLKDDWTFTVR